MRDIWRRDDLPLKPEWVKAVNDRLRGLLHPNIVGSTPLRVLLFSAYKQGLEDAIELYLKETVDE